MKRLAALWVLGLVSLASAIPPPGHPTVKGDLNDDGQADLVMSFFGFQSSNFVFFLHGADYQSSGQFLTSLDGFERAEVAADPLLPPPLPLWTLCGVGDFDHDGRNDILFQDSATSGGLELWLLNGLQRVGLVHYVPPPGMACSAAADFDGDGDEDILWASSLTNTAQTLQVWIMQGTAHVDTRVPSPASATSSAWRIVGAADMSGDGPPELLWQNSSSGALVLWSLDWNLTRTSAGFTNPTAPAAGWTARGVGNFGVGPSGYKGTLDIAFQNGNALQVWYMDRAGNRTGEAPLAVGYPGSSGILVAPR